MWQPRIVPQLYPWIDGKMVKKKEKPPAILVATYGTASSFTTLDLSFPITLPQSAPAQWGKDPAFGHPKRLHLHVNRPDEKSEDIYLNEMCGRLSGPIYYHPEATLDVVLNGGLSNQAYMIAAACITAKKTYRRLAFPFRILARRTCFDVVCSASKLLPDVDKPFSHLFDSDYFISRCGVRLCLLEAGDTSVTMTGVVKDEEGKVLAEHPMIDQRFVPDGVGLAASAVPSHDLARHCYSPYQHVSLLFPFLPVVPSNRADYDILTDAIFALKPAPRLQAIADSIFTQFFTDVNLLAVHCRIEEDWKRVFPTLVASQEDIIRNIRRVHAPSSIYVIGNTANNEYWAELKGKAPEYKWLRKEDFGIVTLGFEEGAVVDRDLACRVPYFLGFSSSTLSLIVGLYRHRMKLKYSFYNVPVDELNAINTPAFLYSSGRPLQDQLA